MNKIFDFCFSLGGSCAGAHQLAARGLRKASLPFDWVAHDTPSTLEDIPRLIGTDFAGWLKRENLRPVPAAKRRSTDANACQPEDAQLHFEYPHDFFGDIFSPGNDKFYDQAVEKYRRRAARLKDWIRQSTNILAVLDVSYPVTIDMAQKLQDALSASCAPAHVSLFIVVYDADKNAAVENDSGNISIQYAQRERGWYDFNTKSWEWRFLDDVKLSGKIHYHNASFNDKPVARKGMPLWYWLNYKMYRHCYKLLMRKGYIVPE